MVEGRREKRFSKGIVESVAFLATYPEIIMLSFGDDRLSIPQLCWLPSIKELESDVRISSRSLNLSVQGDHACRRGVMGLDIDEGSILDVDISKGVERKGTVASDIGFQIPFADGDGWGSITRAQVYNIVEESVIKVKHVGGRGHDLLRHIKTLRVDLSVVD